MNTSTPFFDLDHAERRVDAHPVAQTIRSAFDGVFPNIFRVEAMVSPEVIDAHNTLFVELMMRPDAGPLTRRQRELVAVAVSEGNQCPYCIFHHNNFLDAESEGEGTSTQPTAAEAVLLDFARKVTGTPYAITQADHDALSAAGWSDEERAHAMIIAAYFNFANRVVSASGLPVEEAFLDRA